MKKYERIAKRVQPDNKHFEGKQCVDKYYTSKTILIKKDDEERINAEAEDLFKKCKIEEYNSKMKEKEAYKLYFDEAYKYTNFYEEGDK